MKNSNNSESGAYGPLSGVYDRLQESVDYSAIADFAERVFEKYLPVRPEIVLDLACGTGKLAYELALRGYDMIGVDGSAEMLSEAAERRVSPQNPLYLMQDMRDFELYGSVGATVSCLDSINYLTEEGDIERCFANVANYLDHGGIFLFDVSSPYRFTHVFSDNAYVLEDGEGEVYCGWQNRFSKKTGKCDFLLTVFERREDGSYDRFDEVQTERMYERDRLCSALSGAGLEPLGVWGDMNFSEPKKDDVRWYIAARKN